MGNVAPVEVAPVDVTPVDVAPVGNVAPVVVTPVEVAPVEVAPVEVAPVEVAPVEVAPVDVAPVEVAPVDGPPVDDGPDLEVPSFVAPATPGFSPALDAWSQPAPAPVLPAHGPHPVPPAPDPEAFRVGWGLPTPPSPPAPERPAPPANLPHPPSAPPYPHLPSPPGQPAPGQPARRQPTGWVPSRTGWRPPARSASGQPWTVPELPRRSRPATAGRTSGRGCGPVVFGVVIGIIVVSNLVSHAANRSASPSTGTPGGGTGTTAVGSASTPSVPFSPSSNPVGYPAAQSTPGEVGWVPVVVDNGSYAGDPGSSFVYLSGSGSRPVARWSRPRSDVTMSENAIVSTTTDAVYISSSLGITAIDRSTGEVLWRSSTAVDQAVAAGPTLVALLGDGSVAGFGPKGDQPLWTRPKGSGNASLALVANDIVLLHERSSQEVGTRVARIDPATGRTVAAVAPPCNGRATDRVTTELVPGTSDLVAIPDLAYGCSYRWDARTGALRWARAQDMRAMGYTRSTLWDGRYAVLAGTEGQVLVLDTATGAERTIAGPGRWLLQPRWVGNGRLVAAAVTDEPTARSALIAFDLGSGKQLWSRNAAAGTGPMGANLDIRDRATDLAIQALEPRWLVGGGSRSPRLLTLTGSSGAVAKVEDLDPATGTTTASSSTPVGDLGTASRAGLKGESGRAAVVELDDRLLVLPWGLGYRVGVYPPA